LQQCFLQVLEVFAPIWMALQKLRYDIDRRLRVGLFVETVRAFVRISRLAGEQRE